VFSLVVLDPLLEGCKTLSPNWKLQRRDTYQISKIHITRSDSLPQQLQEVQPNLASLGAL